MGDKSSVLANWVNKQIKDRDWSMRKLAQKAGLSHTQVSNVLSGQRNITYDFCVAISKPLEVDSVDLIRMAGLPLPRGPRRPATVVNETRARYEVPAPVVRPDAEDVMELLLQLDNVEMQQVYDYARWRFQEQEMRRDSSGVRREKPPDLMEIMRLMKQLSSEQRDLIIRQTIENHQKRLANATRSEDE